MSKTRRGLERMGRVPGVHEPGVSDMRLVMVALWEERLCTTCLVARTGVPTARVEDVFTALGGVLTLSKSIAGCQGCSHGRDAIVLM
jgi:hypothetical protein